MPDVHRTSPETASPLRVAAIIALLTVCVMILFIVSACSRRATPAGAEGDITDAPSAAAGSASY